MNTDNTTILMSCQAPEFEIFFLFKKEKQKRTKFRNKKNGRKKNNNAKRSSVDARK